MGLEKREQKLIVGSVERKGDKVIVPESMALKDAITIIDAAIKYEQSYIDRMTTFDADPYEVAAAFSRAVEEVLGTVMGRTTFSFWEGMQPPTMVNIPVAVNETVKVLWGRIVFPLAPKDENSYLVTDVQRTPEGVKGVIGGRFQQKYEKVWDQLEKEVRKNLEKHSIFRGRTLRIQYTKENGELLPMPIIKPWDVQNAGVAQLVFSRELEEQIEDHILTPIRLQEICKEAGIPFKRGVLLAGPYGTGKTELAAKVAGEAASRGMTVVYIEHVRDLPHATRFISRLAPGVIFAEDIDRITTGQRTEAIDGILNTLDGIDTKRFPIMTILTTNYPDKIYKGMVRPGRIDVALKIGPPDAEAAIRLVRNYLGKAYNAVEHEEDEMGERLAGHIPAVIREICERSKLSYISREKKLPGVNTITVQDVVRATGGMQNQIDLLRDRKEEPKPIPITDLLVTRSRAIKSDGAAAVVEA